MSKYYEEIISIVLDEIIEIINALKSGHALKAWAMYLDFCGDVNKLSRRDYGAACVLMWDSIASAGFEIYCREDLKQHAGFQLAY